MHRNYAGIDGVIRALYIAEDFRALGVHVSFEGLRIYEVRGVERGDQNIWGLRAHPARFKSSPGVRRLTRFRHQRCRQCDV